MKSISKLVLVVLLLAASYKMYGQTCSPQIQGCENDCQYALAACLQSCGLDHTSNTPEWSYCEQDCYAEAGGCSANCQAQFCY
jgi:hypothetical protein